MRLQPEYKTILVRELRQRQTESEALLWESLRGRQVGGLKFRRQRPVDRYIGDFCCDELRLIVEIDGGIHEVSEHRETDAEREAYLLAAGYTLLRVPADDVLQNIPVVLRRIHDAVRAIPSQPTAPPLLSPPLPPAKPEDRERGPGGEGRNEDK